MWACAPGTSHTWACTRGTHTSGPLTPGTHAPGVCVPLEVQLQQPQERVVWQEEADTERQQLPALRREESQPQVRSGWHRHAEVPLQEHALSGVTTFLMLPHRGHAPRHTFLHLFTGGHALPGH